ncbi:MAG: ribosome maturation factor RimP [Clostridia bacterium]|nr:ribosome maturation factor RimP [Clostridia bacterium]
MEQKKKKNTASVVEELIAPTVAELGYMIWDVEYVKEGAEMVLRITIDREEGIGIDDCERVHRAIDPLLDEADPIENAYRLEVSSPGVERTLTREAHFDFCLGVEVEAKLYTPFNGMKSVRGILNDNLGDSVVIVSGEDAYEIEKKAIAKISTVFNWDA